MMHRKDKHEHKEGPKEEVPAADQARSHEAEEKTSGPETGQDTLRIPRQEYEKQMERLKELENLRDQLLRSAADFDNAKKRLMRERDEFIKFSQESLLRSLLPALDNFQRALEHATQTQNGEMKNDFRHVISGLQMVYKQLTEVLKNQGIVKIDSVGAKFDPHRHEAIGFVEEEGPADEVVEEIEPGYFLHDRLLRAAKVRVRTAPKTTPAGQEPAKGDDSPEGKQEEIT